MIDPDPPPRPFLPQLVVFDLDGTITRRDTLAGYVFGFACRRPWRLLGYLGVLPTLLRFALRRADHGELKGRVIRGVMGGASQEEIRAWTAIWVPRLLAHGVFPEALAAIAQHRAAGDRLVLMSATVDPRRSITALATSVVPWITCSTSDADTPLAARIRPIPSSTPTDGSRGVVSTLSL